MTEKLYTGLSSGNVFFQIYYNGSLSGEQRLSTAFRLNPRFDLRKHSPDGFSWGYGGSGCAQLALAILCEEFRPDNVLPQKFYQDFKWEVISRLAGGQKWQLTSSQIRAEIEQIKSKQVGIAESREEVENDSH